MVTRQHGAPSVPHLIARNPNPSLSSSASRAAIRRANPGGGTVTITRSKTSM
jgi:hypothetical protein